MGWDFGGLMRGVVSIAKWKDFFSVEIRVFLVAKAWIWHGDSCGIADRLLSYPKKDPVSALVDEV